MRRMRHGTLMLMIVLAMPVLALSACDKTPAPAATTTSTADNSTASPSLVSSPANPAFINKVWKVVPSADRQNDQLYAFLSDGTLLISASNSKPALGRWEIRGGALFMVEEGIAYQTDITALSQHELKLSSHNPGGIKEITLQPAEQPLPQALEQNQKP